MRDGGCIVKAFDERVFDAARISVGPETPVALDPRFFG
jgi:hypothetical protein